LGRVFLALLSEAYDKETLEDGSERTVLRFKPELAPVKIAVLPLMKKDGLAEKASEIFELVAGDYNTVYDETGKIGKRYRRQDEIGTPYCVTVDYDTLEDNTVTVRERDSMEQGRVKIDDLKTFFAGKNIRI